jgi:hypothetical protein
VEFLVKEKGFNEDRVRNAVKKFAKVKSTATQGRLDSFFKVLPKDPSTLKRKVCSSVFGCLLESWHILTFANDNNQGRRQWKEAW